MVTILCLAAITGYGFYSHSATNGAANETGCQIVSGSSRGGNIAEVIGDLSSESEHIVESNESISDIRMICKEDDNSIYQIEVIIKANGRPGDIDEMAIKERFAECAGILGDDVLISYESDAEAGDK